MKTLELAVELRSQKVGGPLREWRAIVDDLPNCCIYDGTRIGALRRIQRLALVTLADQIESGERKAGEMTIVFRIEKEAVREAKKRK